MTTPRLIPCLPRKCKHYLGIIGPVEDPVFICEAFPKGIPEIVLDGSDRHQREIPGDDGIQFELAEAQSSE